MLVEDTHIDGLKVITPQVWQDDRGYFFESYQKQRFLDAAINDEFIQDNQAFSTRFALRGLHYQLPPHAQSKLVRVIHGRVLDAVVDIREGSHTYGAVFTIELSADNHKQLYIPQGFAHGYLTLSDSAIFVYKCDAYYNREAEAGIYVFDRSLQIDWGINMDKAIISEKDRVLPAFGDHQPFSL